VLLTEGRMEIGVAADGRYYVIGDYHLVLHKNRDEAFAFYIVSVLSEAATVIREVTTITGEEGAPGLDPDTIPAFCEIDDLLCQRTNSALALMHGKGARIWWADKVSELYMATV
jgi:hypothetical protein